MDHEWGLVIGGRGRCVGGDLWYFGQEWVIGEINLFLVRPLILFRSDYF
jgi:hypothetical protein